MVNVGELKVIMDLDQTKFQAGLQTASQRLQATGQKMSQMGQKLTMGVTLPLGLAAAAAVKAASDAEEMGSKFNVVFGEMSGETKAWAEEFADSVDRSKYAVMEFMSGFQDTFVPLGYARDEAAELSKQLTTLTYDLASFYNVSESEAAQALSSALVGNHEAVRKFGIVLNQATLDQELLNMGIEGGARAASTQALVMARLNVIMNGTVDAQGDLLRTQDSFANQVRALKDDLQVLAVELGQELIPIMRDVISEVKKGTEWFSNLTDEQKELVVKAGLVVAALGPVVFIIGKIATTAAGAATAIKALSVAMSGANLASAGITGGAATAASAGAVVAGFGLITAGALAAGLAIDKSIEFAVENGIIDATKRGMDKAKRDIEQVEQSIVVPVRAQSNIINMDVQPDLLQQQLDQELFIHENTNKTIGVDEQPGGTWEYGGWGVFNSPWFNEQVLPKWKELEHAAVELKVAADTSEAWEQIRGLVEKVNGMKLELGTSMANTMIGLGETLERQREEGGASFDVRTGEGMGNLIDILKGSLGDEQLRALGISEEVIDAIQGEPLETAIQQLETEQNIQQLAHAQANKLAEQYNLNAEQKASLESYLGELYGQAVGFEAQVLAAIQGVQNAISALDLSVTVNVDQYLNPEATAGGSASGVGGSSSSGNVSATVSGGVTPGMGPGTGGHANISDDETHNYLEQQNSLLEDLNNTMKKATAGAGEDITDPIKRWRLV
jgi:hypothetical protein